MKREQTPLILVFSTAYLPHIGGAEIAIHEIARRAEKLRFLIITSRFSRGLPKYEESGNIIIRRVGLGIKFGTFIFKKNKKDAFKEYLINCLRVFIFVIIPLLIIAAIIESSLIIFLG